MNNSSEHVYKSGDFNPDNEYEFEVP